MVSVCLLLPGLSPSDKTLAMAGAERDFYPRFWKLPDGKLIDIIENDFQFIKELEANIVRKSYPYHTNLKDAVGSNVGTALEALKNTHKKKPPFVEVEFETNERGEVQVMNWGEGPFTKIYHWPAVLANLWLLQTTITPKNKEAVQKKFDELRGQWRIDDSGKVLKV